MADLEVQWSRGSFPQVWRCYFDAANVPALRSEAFFQALFDDGWQSVLVSDGESAMLHSFCTLEIPNTGYYDAEAWIGYGGPLFNEAARATDRFRHEAVHIYQEYCRSHRIVAESVRFEPSSNEHVLLQTLPSVSIESFRDVVLVPVDNTASERRAHYRSECVRRLKKYRSQYRIVISGEEGAERFHRLYTKSLSRVGAATRWRFSAESLRRLSQMQSVRVLEVFTQDSREPVSAALLVLGKVSHSLLVGNLYPQAFPSACDVLMDAFLDIAQHSSSRIACLGGGGRTDTDDPLLRYKLRFSRNGRTPLHTGLLVHDPSAYRHLVLAAVQPSANGATNIDPIMQRLFPYRC